MKAQEYFDKWPNIDWSDDKQHFAERKFIELLARYDWPLLEDLEPQVPIDFNDGPTTKSGAIDFVVEGKYPIEIDGESYHAENKVSSRRFDSLTAKQNEVVNKYGNITRITYHMLQNDPEGAIGVVHKNIQKFKKKEKEYEENLKRIKNVEDRKAFEEAEMKKRRDEFEKELKTELENLENLRNEKHVLSQEVEKVQGDLSSYQDWWSKHKKFVALMVGIVLLVAISITFAVFTYNDQVREAEHKRQAEERSRQIEVGEICMTVDEVKQYVGKTGVCVEYYVNYVNSTKYGYIWISDRQNGLFSAFIKNKNVMTIDEAKNYRNKTIEVHGNLTAYEKDGTTTYEIVVGSKDQIKIKE